ncbi:hypothetical protein GGR56DRAFT_351039 [Xylariaceae sp. FL0804]|nr:hypothetical protein GGR56DRAFT_351039 [Xylariaceae sp. FL0804]
MLTGLTLPASHTLTSRLQLWVRVRQEESQSGFLTGIVLARWIPGFKGAGMGPMGGTSRAARCCSLCGGTEIYARCRLPRPEVAAAAAPPPPPHCMLQGGSDNFYLGCLLALPTTPTGLPAHVLPPEQSCNLPVCLPVAMHPCIWWLNYPLCRLVSPKLTRWLVARIRRGRGRQKGPPRPRNRPEERATAHTRSKLSGQSAVFETCMRTHDARTRILWYVQNCPLDLVVQHARGGRLARRKRHKRKMRGGW